MRQTLLRAISFTVGLLAIAPATFAFDRGATMAFCTDAVHGTCWVSKRQDEPYISVRFKCQVNSEDHWTQLMGATNYEIPLNVKEAVLIIRDRPKPGPVHDSHVYCRKVTGTAPYTGIAFVRTGNSGFVAEIDGDQKCKIKPISSGSKKKIY